MAIKFYKKLSPGNPVVIENLNPSANPPHVAITFTTLDGLTGYYATAEEKIQEWFTRFMREQRYGLTEVSEKEFHEEYVEKKTPSIPSSTKPWREEMRGSSVRPTGYDPVAHHGSEKVQAAVAVRNRNDIQRQPPITMEESASAPVQPAKPTGPTPAVPFVPNVGKRKGRPQ